MNTTHIIILAGFTLVVITILIIVRHKKTTNIKSTPATNAEQDTIEKLDGALIQHGNLSDRIYLMKIGQSQTDELIPQLEELAESNSYSKIFAKVPASELEPFTEAGYRKEGIVPNFYSNGDDGYFIAKYPDPERKIEELASQYDEVMQITIEKVAQQNSAITNDNNIRLCTTDDLDEMAKVYDQVFPSYPFPINDPAYLEETMESHIKYFCIEKDGKIAALSSSEIDFNSGNAEMTDFATLPEMRGNNFASSLLARMEKEMRKMSINTVYTIARAISPGMNITFARGGYSFGGRLVNNTNISGKIESMNIWYKSI